MNLATRCTECGTVFRVVEDQLKVSEGWVRCGRCSAVFNAQAELFDLDLPRPAEPAPPPNPEGVQIASQPPAPVSASVSTHAPPQGAAQAASQPPSPAADPDDWSPQLPPIQPPQAANADEWPSGGPFDDRPDADANAEAPMDAVLLRRPPEADSGSLLESSITSTAWVGLSTAPALPGDESPAVIVSIGEAATLADGPPVQIDADEATLTPSFMHEGHASSFWDRAAMRHGLMVATIALALALLLQMAVVWRDPLAAHVPALRPALVGLCKVLGCLVGPLRRIDRLAVESSGLTRIEGAPLHRLSVTLRNRADTPVLAPAIDLTVTDAQGKLVARRVLQLSELGVTATTLDAGAELPLQALLNTGDRRVTGYAIELFYP